MRLALIAFGFAVLMASTCAAAAADVAANAGPTADFAAYRTYGWVERKTSTADRPAVLDQVKSAIDKQLAAHGYARAADPDLTVVFSVGARDRIEEGAPDIAVVQAPTGPMILGADNPQKRVSEGALTIRMFDARTKRQVFRAVATERLSPRGADARTIDRAVRGALAQLPVRR